jgi:hypothetical protein
MGTKGLNLLAFSIIYPLVLCLALSLVPPKQLPLLSAGHMFLAWSALNIIPGLISLWRLPLQNRVFLIPVTLAYLLCLGGLLVLESSAIACVSTNTCGQY